MDSKVENIIDLGLVNYVRHPSDPNYIVFRFSDKNRADDFEKTLKSSKIWFEKDREETRNKIYFLFGVHNRDYTRVERINFDVEGRNRKFIIRNNFFRWALILFSTAVMLLAIVGYCSQPGKVGEKTEIHQTSE